MKKSTVFLNILLFAVAMGNAQPSAPYRIMENYIASGYMGDTQNLMVRRNVRDVSRPDSLCVRLSYSPGPLGWGGVYWQYPANNWCNRRGRDFSRSGYTMLSYYVKGERGGEEVRFRVGHDCGDSYVSDEITRRLTTAWERVTIPLGNDLSNITGAFCWVIDSHAASGTVAFYLDDLVFE